MITVAEVTRKYVLESPLLEEGLDRSIINLSALARELRPRIEEELGKNVSPAAIIMALKRLSPELLKGTRRKPMIERQLGDLIVRSNLVELIFRHSDSIWEKQKQLLHRIEHDRDTFLTYTQGIFEVMLVASSSIEKAVLDIFSAEKVVCHLRDLSAITIRLSPRTVYVPGVYYSILKHLAWENVNVVDVVSTYTEFTVLIENQNVDRAFSILKRFLSE